MATNYCSSPRHSTLFAFRTPTAAAVVVLTEKLADPLAHPLNPRTIVDVLERVPQGGAGNFDEALHRLTQLENEKDGCGDGASAQKKDRQSGRIGWSEQTEADEEKANPENQDDEKRERELVLLLFNQ